jgi:hypothetical protein
MNARMMMNMAMGCAGLERLPQQLMDGYNKHKKEHKF